MSINFSSRSFVNTKFHKENNAQKQKSIKDEGTIFGNQNKCTHNKIYPKLALALLTSSLLCGCTTKVNDPEPIEIIPIEYEIESEFEEPEEINEPEEVAPEIIYIPHAGKTMREIIDEYFPQEVLRYINKEEVCKIISKNNGLGCPEEMQAYEELDISHFNELEKQVEQQIAQDEENFDNIVLNDHVGMFDFSDFTVKLNENQQKDLENFEEHYYENIHKYERLEEETRIPKELIAAIHWREGNGSFDVYLHNGEPLGKPTTKKPVGIYFENFNEAAKDALNKHIEHIIGCRTYPNENCCLDWENSLPTIDNIDSWYNFAKAYNGNLRKDSSYIWAGTNNYEKGKYVSDNNYDPEYVDQQLGIAVMLKTLLEK